MKTPMVKKITPVLFVEEVEPCVKFWVERLGFTKTIEVPEGTPGHGVDSIVIPSLHLHDLEAAMTGPAAVGIVLNESERGELEARVRRRKIARADAMRAEIVLLAADGLNNCAIADEVGASRMTVLTWRKRFAAQRLDGLDARRGDAS